MDDSNIVIVGAKGQLGIALQATYPGARAVDSEQLDISDLDAVNAFDWSNAKVIINAAGYTNVDGAETPEGRVAAWKVNATAVKNLVHTAWENQLTLIHISSDYVFDGSQSPHTEDEPFAPLSVYGASKAAGDLLVSQLDEHYILRTTWVVGEGKNFVRTMLGLAQKGINPTVVADQVGRLTFTSELARAIEHILTAEAPFGTYNISNGGQVASWADVAREVFKEAGVNNTVTNTTNAEYYAGNEGIAPRPLNSELDLTKIQATGFDPVDWKENLKNYIAKEKSA